jgi:tetratricopeptide (TPR) repeat protein
LSALLALLIAGAQVSPAPAASSKAPAPAEPQRRFLELLRTYPERPPAETFALVARLIDQTSQSADFPERDRAEYWIGSARLAASDREGARQWFARLARDYPASLWTQRSWLGLGDAFAQERRYDAALELYARAQTATDAAVRELGRISASQALVLRTRQRWAFGCGAFACAVALWLLFGARRGPLFPLPTELRILWPVLAVLALLSSRVDAAPRATILTLCVAGAALTGLSGLRQRAVQPRGLARALHLVLTVSALGAVAYLAIYRGDLIGMVLETFRAGPE